MAKPIGTSSAPVTKTNLRSTVARPYEKSRVSGRQIARIGLGRFPSTTRNLVRPSDYCRNQDADVPSGVVGSSVFRAPVLTQLVPLSFRGVFFALLLTALSAGCSTPSSSAEVEPGPVALRRLTADQYERTVHDVLGAQVTVPNRIDPDDRRDGLLAVGSTFAGVTPSGLEKYEAAAATIAEQALGADHREALVQCQPASLTGPDEACARSFIERIGRKLFRRPLSDAEVDARVEIANTGARELASFHGGLELALMSFLVSPEFLFRVEEAEEDPSDPSRLRLTSISMAPRLSYLLWNTTPDEELLAAAERGDLVTDAGLAAQLERLLASTKLETGLRSIFSDLYDFRQFDDGLVRKDTALFPAYTQPMVEEAKEQTLRTIVSHLAQDLDYRALFTTQESFLTRRLGVVSQVPVPSPSGWEPYRFPDDSGRVGLLSHISFNALHAHPGRSSATLRGNFVREVLLCQEVPAPPANIDFSIVENTTGELRTARDRLEAHVSNDACAGCHALTDPIGLALENFDAIGMYREEENGAPIDSSGQLDGAPYEDAAGLGAALSEHPSLGPCLVRNLYRYTVGREPEAGEEPLLEALAQHFAESGYRTSELLRELLMSDGFRTTSGPRGVEETGDES